MARNLSVDRDGFADRGLPQSHRPPPNEALGHWLYRTQGLVGVFPPREDVRVGDVHLYLNDPDGDDHASLYQAPRWSYLPGTGEYASIRSMIIIMSSIGGAENTA